MDGQNGRELRNGAGEGRSAADRRQAHGVPRDPGFRQAGPGWGAPLQDGPHRDALHPEGHRLDAADLPDLCRRRVHGAARPNRVRLGAVPILPVLLVVLSSSRSLHQDMNA